jgi:hypothetical protein
LRRYNKVYISADHEKSHFGMGSPGPASLGKAVQVDPIKLTLKVPGTKHLKLKIRDCL